MRSRRGIYLTETADLGRHNWWQAEALPDDGYEPWELQDQRVSPVREADVVGEIQHVGWTDALTATVRLSAEVEEQYARQGPLGDNVDYRTRLSSCAAGAGVQMNPLMPLSASGGCISRRR